MLRDAPTNLKATRFMNTGENTVGFVNFDFQNQKEAKSNSFMVMLFGISGCYNSNQSKGYCLNCLYLSVFWLIMYSFKPKLFDLKLHWKRRDKGRH